MHHTRSGAICLQFANEISLGGTDEVAFPGGICEDQSPNIGGPLVVHHPAMFPRLCCSTRQVSLDRWEGDQ